MSKDMTLWEHFGELRKRIILSLIALIIASTLSYYYWPLLLELLTRPADIKDKLVYLNLMEPFVSRFKLALWAGFLISFPLILYQVMAFVVPGLKRAEKGFIIVMSFFMIILFFGGVYFGYEYILGVGITWLEAQGAGLIRANLTVSQYISFVGLFLLAFGVSFETPVVVVILVRLGVVRPIQLVKHWRIAIVAILLFSAIATPDWSPITMGLMAIPMFGLYILGVILSFIFAPRKKKELQQAEA